METLLNNLHLYEIVLLILGILLFLILSGALIFYIKKGENIKKLLLFFALPIVMIGYPSIQEIQIESDRIAFKKYTDRIKEDPTDTEAIEKTKDLTVKLESRAKTTEDIEQISEAYLLLEQPDKAIVFADKVIQEEEKNTIPKQKPKTNKNVEKLKEFRELAKLQKDIKSNKISITDTVKIKKRLKNMNISNSKIRQYMNKKYRPQIKSIKPKN